MRRLEIIAVAFLLLTGAARSQGTRADYQKAEQVMKGSLGKLLIDGTVTPNWIRQSPRMWYRKTVGDAKEFLMVDAERNTRAPAFDHEKMAAALSKATGRTYGARTLPFDDFTLAAGGEIEVDAEGTRWSCNLRRRRLHLARARPAAAGGRRGRRPPRRRRIRRAAGTGPIARRSLRCLCPRLQSLGPHPDFRPGVPAYDGRHRAPALCDRLEEPGRSGARSHWSHGKRAGDTAGRHGELVPRFRQNRHLST